MDIMEKLFTDAKPLASIEMSSSKDNMVILDITIPVTRITTNRSTVFIPTAAIITTFGNLPSPVKVTASMIEEALKENDMPALSIMMDVIVPGLEHVLLKEDEHS